MRIKSNLLMSFWALWQLAITNRRAGKGSQHALLKAEIKSDHLLTSTELDHIEARSKALYRISKLWPSKIQCAQRSYALWDWLDKSGFHPTMEVGWQDQKAHAWIRIGSVVVNDDQDVGDHWISLRKEKNNQSALNIKNEFRMKQTYWKIAIEAARLQLGEERDIKEDLTKIDDWESFFKSVDRWNIGSAVNIFLQKHSQSLPEDVVRRVQQRISLRKAQHTAVLSELVDICCRFKSADINYLYLKGFSLPARSNTDPLARDMVDLDFLVPPAQLQIAHEVLTKANYVAKEPIDEIGFARLSRVTHHEVIYSSPKAILPIELHWRLSEIKILEKANMDFFLNQTSEVSISGNQVRTLNQIATTILAALHGARHHWFRLKWLTDFAALIRVLPPQDQTSFVDTCSEKGCTRVIAASLMLARDLLQINLPKFAAEMICLNDPKRDELAGIWLKMCAPAINDRFRYTANIRRAEYLTNPGVKARLRWRLFEMSSPDFPLIKRYPHVHSRLEVIGAKMHRRLFL
jgi:hypothetical protein